MDVLTQPPPIPPAPGNPSSSAATTALVFSIVGLVCCGGAVSPIGWYLGNKEMKAVDAGLSAISNRGLAQIAVVLGIIGTVIFAMWFIWFLLGGMAVVLGILGSAAGS
jgi:hypothetical protein